MNLLCHPQSVFFLTAIIQSFAVAHDVQDPPVVAEVVVVGNHKTPTPKVMELIKTRPGDRFSHAQAYDDVSCLIGARLFQRIGPVRTERIADGRVRVILPVGEFPNKVREIVFHNSRLFTPRMLADFTKVQVGKPLDRWQNITACFEIQEYLRRHGHYFANVSLVEGYDENHDRVVFNVMEGPKVCFRKIQFFNRNKLPFVAEFSDQVGSVQGEIFSHALVDDMLFTLERFYQSRGYLDARAGREIRFSDDFAHVDVTIFIEPGKRYRVAELALEGQMDRQMRGTLERLIKVRKGEFYSESELEADKHSLSNWGGRRGKRLAVRSDVTTIADRPGLARVTYTVDDAPVDRVGAIRIVGNTVTRDAVIRKHISLEPGEILDYTQLPIIEKRLTDLEIFLLDRQFGIRPTLSVVSPKKGMPADVKDIVVYVEEARTGSLLLTAGVNSQKGIVVRAVIEERNFDPTCWPKSWDDVRAGRIFRGGGQKIRLDSGDIQLFP